MTNFLTSPTALIVSITMLVISLITLLVFHLLSKKGTISDSREEVISVPIMLVVVFSVCLIFFNIIAAPFKVSAESHNEIVNSIEDTYGVVLHQVSGEQPITTITSGKGSPVNVTIEHQGRYYQDTYLLVYDHEHNAPELVLVENPMTDSTPPTPEELEKKAQDGPA